MVDYMNKTADIIRDGKDIVVVANGKEVFRKPKTTQTVAIAHDIYMGYKYENGRQNNGSIWKVKGGVIKMCQRKTKQMREFEPILKANGYREIRSNGSHFIYSNGTNQITVNKDLNKMVRKRLIKENNLIER